MSEYVWVSCAGHTGFFVCVLVPAKTHFYVSLHPCICLCACMYECVCAYMCARAPPWWQGVSIMINRQTRQLSHAITLHYGSQNFKVKMNGSSLTWRLHISSFFCCFSGFYSLEETCLFSPSLFCWEDRLCLCHCLKCTRNTWIWGCLGVHPWSCIR